MNDPDFTGDHCAAAQANPSEDCTEIRIKPGRFPTHICAVDHAVPIALQSESRTYTVNGIAGKCGRKAPSGLFASNEMRRPLMAN
jgi:hypothetical protein